MNIYHYEVDRTETDYYTVEANTEEEAGKKFFDEDREDRGTKVWDKTVRIVKVEEKPCEECDGTGRIEVESTVYPNEPHTAYLGDTVPCPLCTKEKEYQKEE